MSWKVCSRPIGRTSIAAVCLLSAAQPVSAQTSPTAAQQTAGAVGPEAKGPDAQEIIVTAQKRSERLSDVPLSISAVTSDTLKARGVTDTSLLERLIPGFTVQKTFLGQPVFYIRGVGFSDNSVSASPAVSVYVDQIALPYSAMARGAALDLERVEVLKGPQGTLFGQNSTAGAVNYIAAKPTDTLRADFDVSYGRFSALDVSGSISGPLAKGVTARLALQVQNQGDWQYSASRPGDTRGQKRFYNGRLLVDFAPTDKLRFEIGAQMWRDRSDTQAAQLSLFTPSLTGPGANQTVIDALSALTPTPNNARVADWDPGSRKARDDRFYQLSLHGDLALSDTTTLTSLTAYSDLDAYSPVDADGTSFANAFYNVPARLKTISQELRLAGRVGSKLQWMAGANYQHADVDERAIVHALATNNMTTPFPYNDFTFINTQKVNTYAAFGSLDYKITSAVTLRGSGRYTKENRTYRGCLADAGDGALGRAFGFLSTIFSGSPTVIAPGSCITFDDATNKPLPIVTKPLNESNFSWRTGIDWKVGDTLVYANVAKGYKSGSFSTAIPAIFASQLTPVTQESIMAYEVGLKTAILDRRVQLNGALFYYKYTDKQLQGFVVIQPFGPLGTLVNIPRSNVKGAEFDVALRPIQGLKASVAGVYLDTIVKADPAVPIDPFGIPGSYVGERFPLTPKYQITADAEQAIRIKSGVQGYLGASLLYHSRTSAAFGQSSALARSIFNIPSYALVDLRAGVKFDDSRVGLEIFGRNVTNKYYIVNVARGIDTVTRYAGAPATYGVRLSWRM